MKSYPDVDLKLTDEISHFHIYVRQSQKLREKHSLSQMDVYEIFYTGKKITWLSQM